jgi:hypothetical protein
MNYRKLFFTFFIIIINFNVFSQSLAPGFPKLMYVTSREGLRERTEPSTRGRITKTFLYGETVQVFSRQSTPATIDDITDYWYSTRYSDNSDRWIFGGYLSEELPNDLPIIMGSWDDENNKRQYYFFGPDHRYAEGYKETDMGIWGTWKLNGNVLILILDSAMNYAVIDPPDIINVQMTIIDRNNIILIFPNNEKVRLTRNKSGW